ncbi:MAG: ABC transporter substrate-binding protein [Bacillota bacterium]
MKKFLVVLTILLAVGLISGCSPSNSETSPEADSSGEPVKVIVVLDWVPNTNHTGLFVAKDKGFYADQGLDVEIIQPTSGGAAQLVAAQQADFGVSYQEEVTLARTNDIPIKSIAAVIQHNTSGFASPKDKNITSPKDFAGKKYGGWGSPMEHAMLESLVTKHGVSINTVEEVNIGSADFMTSVQKDVDFAWIFYGWDGIRAELQNVPLNIIMIKDEDPALDYYTPVLIASEKTIAEKPEVVKKFLAATTEGYEFAISNPDDSAEILLDNAPELDAELVKASQRWLADKYQDDAPFWGVQKAEVWQRYADWMLNYGLLEKEIDPAAAFTNDYLPKK